MKNKEDETLESLKIFYEAMKYHHGYYKHMMTLSVGSILIIVTLLEGIFKKPEGIFAIIISLFGFVICLLGALVMLGGYCNVGGLIFIIYIKIPDLELPLNEKKLPKYVLKYKKKIESIANILDITGLITGCAFLLGRIMLLVFTFINLAKRI